MATDTLSCVAQIGETAGQIWQALSTKGTLTVAKLVKEDPTLKVSIEAFEPYLDPA